MDGNAGDKTARNGTDLGVDDGGDSFTVFYEGLHFSAYQNIAIRLQGHIVQYLKQLYTRWGKGWDVKWLSVWRIGPHLRRGRDG